MNDLLAILDLLNRLWPGSRRHRRERIRVYPWSWQAVPGGTWQPRWDQPSQTQNTNAGRPS